MSKRILIVGAGIGGLTLANALQQRGFAAHIAEQAPGFRTVGAGISLSFNAIAVFDALGLGESVRGLALRMDQPQMCRADGSVIRTMSLPSLVGHASAGLWLLARSELHHTLASGLPPSCFQMNKSVRSVTQFDDKVNVYFTDGQESQYDLLVGADGVHSSVRQSVFPDADPPRDVGVACWQFLVPDLDLGPTFREHLGHGRRVGVVPLTQARTYGFLTRNCKPGEQLAWGSDPQRVKKEFAEFGGMAKRMLDRLDDVEGLLPRALVEVRLERWHQGRVVLLGDAAHAMTPNLGQGAAMAIEDAWQLALCLSRDPSSHVAALNEYESLRRRRVKQIQARSARVGMLLQSSRPSMIRLRDGFVRWSPQCLHAANFRNLYLNGPLAGEEAVQCSLTEAA